MKITSLATFTLVLFRLGTGAAQEPVGLRCQLALSIDTAFLDRWDHTKLRQMRVPAADHVVRGQHFGIYPFFSGYALDEHGGVRVALDLRIARPDGKTYFEERGVKALDQPGGDGTSLLLPGDIR